MSRGKRKWYNDGKVLDKRWIKYIQGFLVIRMFGLRGFGFTHLGKIINIKKNFGLRRVHGYTREFFHLRRVIQFYRIFGRAQAKFSFYEILELHCPFQNVTPPITEPPPFFSKTFSTFPPSSHVAPIFESRTFKVAMWWKKEWNWLITWCSVVEHN